MGIGDVFSRIREERETHQWIHPLIVEGLASTRVVKCPGPEDWLSASKVPDLCTRHIVMCHRMDLVMVDEQDHFGRWHMDRGVALHSVLQEMWLGPLGYLKGGWRCPKCAHVHGAVKKMVEVTDENGVKTMEEKDEVNCKTAVFLPKKCEKCGKKEGHFARFKFVEPFISDEESKVRGPTDGILCLPGHKDDLFDLKCISDLSKVREKPLLSHVKQLHWYMGPEGYRRGRVVYLDPGAKKLETAMIEHVVDFDPKLHWEEKEKVRGLREALADSSRPVPPCPNGGKSTYGQCACVELAVRWARRGA